LKPRLLQAAYKGQRRRETVARDTYLKSLPISNIRLENCNVIPGQILELGGRSFVANKGEDFVLAVGTQLPDEFKLNKRR
jgi:hypothetical protein